METLVYACNPVGRKGGSPITGHPFLQRHPNFGALKYFFRNMILTNPKIFAFCSGVLNHDKSTFRASESLIATPVSSNWFGDPAI